MGTRHPVRTRLHARFAGLPLLTMALNLALIATIFVTRERWKPWVVEQELPRWLGDGLSRTHLSPDRKHVVVSGSASHVLWDIEAGRCLAAFEGMCGGIAFSPDCRRVVFAAGRIRSWGPLAGDLASEPGTEPAPAREDEALVVDLKAGRPLFSLEAGSRSLFATAYSPDGDRIVTTSLDRTARVWDAETGRQLLVLRGHEELLFRAAFSPDGTRIVTAAGDRTARIWSAETGAQLAVLNGDGRRTVTAEWACGGRRVLTWWHAGGVCRVWDAQTYELAATLEPVHSCSVSPDGRLVVTSHSKDTLARAWDAETGALVCTLEGHRGEVSRHAFSPDGERLLTTSSDGTARVWDVRTGTCLLTLPDPPAFRSGHPTYAAFTPGGRRIVTWRSDDPVKTWDASTGEPVAAITDAPVDRCVVLQDARVLTCSQDGGFQVFRWLRPGRWWGVFWLPHFWLIVVLAVALVLSGWRDLRKLRRVA